MIPPDIPLPLRKLMLSIAEDVFRAKDTESQILRRDLSDQEYADWFLNRKISKGALNPAHALNDFVLFRIAFGWPVGAERWCLEASDLYKADFSLGELLAIDLVNMAREGLTDGYTSAAWYAKVAAVWYVAKEKKIPDALFDFLQEVLFVPPTPRQGRKKTDGMDRDRVIRNLVEGLLARNLGHPAALSHARAVTVQALGRKGIGMTEDAVRKLCERAVRSDRERRLWGLLAYGQSGERKV